VRYTPGGGQIDVELFEDQGPGKQGPGDRQQVVLRVSDTGIGIAPEFLPHVFERFRQADSGIAREHGGLGLGLAIARQLTEMHGGTIDVSSGGVGHGATFSVKIPVMILHRRASDVSPRVHPRHARSAPHATKTDLTGIRVLAVDDEQDALSLVLEVLEAAGARVKTARSADEAWTQLNADVPDVLLADLGMPHVDGFGFIDRVRRHPDQRVRDVPAAALTAYARSEDRMRALRAGFHLHLAKPIDPSELVTTVAALAERFITRGDDA
jgi:CheY-like chemotaxis protein